MVLSLPARRCWYDDLAAVTHRFRGFRDEAPFLLVPIYMGVVLYQGNLRDVRVTFSLVVHLFGNSLHRRGATNQQRGFMKPCIALLHPILSLVFVTMALHAQEPTPSTYHTQSFGSIDPRADEGGRFSGLIGYAAPDGREYALLGGHHGTYVIDVTEAPVKKIALLPGTPSDWRELKTYGHYAYVVNEGGGGLQIIDLSALPAAPTIIKNDTSVFHTAHTVVQQGNYLYVHGSDLGAGANGGTLIYDIATDPLNPSVVGMFSGHYVHDASVRNDTMYAAAIYEGKVSIIHLSPDRKTSTLVAEITYPGAGTHNTATTVDGSYLMTTDEVGSTQKTLKVWDIRNTGEISKVADFTGEPEATIHNAYTVGRLAYVSWYTGGTRIIDIADPTDPVEVGYFDAYPGTTAAYSGNWEVYPYLPSGKILASYMENGLQVFTFDGAQPGRIAGRVRNAVTNEPIPNAIIRVDVPEKTIKTDNQGMFKLGGALGTVNYIAYAENYQTKNGQLQLANIGSETSILLEPLPLNTYTVEVLSDASGQPVSSFAYRVSERNHVQGLSLNSTREFTLPRDSVYHVFIGSWGYKGETVELRDGFNPTAQVRLKQGYSDDAELNLGWSLAASTDRAYIGRWERGVPLEVKLLRGNDEVVVQPGSDNTPGDGVQAFFTGLSSFSEYSRPVFGGSTSLTSPRMDLTSYYDPYINAALWYSNEGWYQGGDPLPLQDTLEILISNDDGATWTMMQHLGEPTGGWKDFHFRVRDAITPTDAMRFMVRASDSIAPSVVEAGMDDFSVTDGSSASVAVPVAAGHGISASLIPNPIGGSGNLAITLPVAQRNGRLELISMLGERIALLHEGAMGEGTTLIPINATGLPAGRYVWRLKLDDGRIASGAMVVAR